MSYKAHFRISKDADRLYKCLKPEIHKGERASMDIRKKGDELTIMIDAKDSTALRAMTNSVTQMLSIFETTGRID